MKLSYLKYILPSISFLLFTSCIKDGEVSCPEYTIVVGVEDKNYSNILEISDLTPLAEDLPMLDYIANLSLWWHGIGTDMGRSRSLSIPSQKPLCEIESGFFPYGSYDVMPVGNMVLAEHEYQSGKMIIELHPEHSEGEDIYIARQTIDIPLTANIEMWLARTKGRLIMKFADFPQETVRINAVVSGIYATIDSDGNYDASTRAEKSFVPGFPDYNGYYGMLLAPADATKNAILTLVLYNASGGIIDVIHNIPIQIERNKLTLIQPVYDPETNEWTVLLYINGNWEAIHNLEIN